MWTQMKISWSKCSLLKICSVFKMVCLKYKKSTFLPCTIESMETKKMTFLIKNIDTK